MIFLLKFCFIYFLDFFNVFIFYLKVFVIWIYILMCFLIVWNKLEDLVGFDFLIFYKFYRIYKLNFRFI